ncbi:MAG: acyltransferase family protein [Betaproteobacteria bacterium]|nr:acyltransferase family protein [Betaproteobacteria bacterium]
MNRRHDIDALRALAFALLIAYHIGMLYVTEWGWHLKSTHLVEFLQIPMLTVNRWRMDLIFLISGISTAFLFGQRTPSQFFKERSARLLIPLLFGVAVIVPLQPYCQGVANGLVEPGYGQFLLRYFSGYAWPKGAFDGWQYGFTWNHLWYLVYLFVYTTLLVLLRRPMHALGTGRIRAAFENLRGWRLVSWPAVLLLLYTVLLQPHFPHKNNLIEDWYAHAVYFTMFLAGFWIGKHAGLWEEIRRLRFGTLWIALASYAAYMSVRALLPDEPSPLGYLAVWALRNLYVWSVLLAILGFASQHLNKPFRWLPWATESVYPWYILHQSLIILIAYWVVPLKLHGGLEFAIVAGGTVAGCWALTSLVIARIDVLRPLFGLKRLPRPMHALQETAIRSAS